MKKVVNAESHYEGNPVKREFKDLPEYPANIKNVGWTLGNDCPYRCTHCYSMSARRKGRNLTISLIDRIVGELVSCGIDSVNLGGNEPLYTNGINPKETLLPYIIDKLVSKGILVGLTTAGVTLSYLARHYPASVDKLNDIDISIDSPIESEHDQNRGAPLFRKTLEALAICKDRGKEHSIIMCGMSWNFDILHLSTLVELANRFGSNIRINTLKPVEPQHMKQVLSSKQYYEGFSFLMKKCQSVDLGEPPLATVTNYAKSQGCPCGTTSFRIHSITPDGKIPVSPCVYLHDYKTGDLSIDSLHDIINSESFRVFRRRVANPEQVKGCSGCELLNLCKGGCAARGYLYTLHHSSVRRLFSKDPHCPKKFGGLAPFRKQQEISNKVRLVHQNYLCTWIGKPIEN